MSRSEDRLDWERARDKKKDGISQGNNFRGESMGNAVQKIFVDGIESVTVIDGILHLEFFSYLPGEKDKAAGNKLKNEISLELITSLNGIMRIHEGIDKIVAEMKKISKTGNADGNTGQTSGSSANFN